MFDEYWQDFREHSENVKQPKLFYYGEIDWAIGPEHYKGAKPTKLILRGSKVGQMPFLEDKADLMKAIIRYK